MLLRRLDPPCVGRYDGQSGRHNRMRFHPEPFREPQIISNFPALSGAARIRCNEPSPDGPAKPSPRGLIFRVHPGCG